MVKLCLLFCFAVLLQGVLSSGVNVQCSPDDATCQTTDQASLLQSRVRTSLETEVAADQYVYGPYSSSRPLMDYFKAWGQGKLRNHLARTLKVDLDPQRISLAQLDSRTLTAKEADVAFMATAAAECPDQAAILAQMSSLSVLETEPINADGVMHVLLQGQGGELQYMAVRQGADGQHQTLVADPPVCNRQGNNRESAPQLVQSGPAATAAPAGSATSSVTGSAGGVLHSAPKRSPGGLATPLNLNDTSVLDCVKLFHRTLLETCQKDVQINVISARAVIIAGLAVHMEVDVCSSGVCRKHIPECTFQKHLNGKDASLLQQRPQPQPQPQLQPQQLQPLPAAPRPPPRGRPAPPAPGSDQTEEERQGMQAVLKLHVPLCNVDTTEGVNTQQMLEMRLMQTFRMGENSHDKGFEHVNDHLPKWSALEGVTVLDSVDLRATYPNCYPAISNGGVGSEVVRNQGTCGSCWAFASSTTTMASLCISNQAGSHTHNSPTDRMEVSVQKIISCAKADQSPQSGCEGGNMGDFDSGASKWGLTAEKDNVYRCGGGNPLNHFEQKDTSCETFPWGGSCTGQAQAGWLWGGSASLSGEQTMLTFMATGHPLYGSMDVYANFMHLGTEVYEGPGYYDAKKGGHAVDIMGYGTDGGKKYWLLQNSWGTDGGWGEAGFGKMLRGTNLCDIETDAFAVRAWVQGGTEPPCMDSSDGTGMSSTGGKPYIPCSQAMNGPYGNICVSYPTVKKRCMKSCGSCGSGSNGAGTSTPPGPAPAPVQGPAPGPAPDRHGSSHAGGASNGGCADWVKTQISLNGADATCAQLSSFCTSHKDMMKQRCPVTCGFCGQ